MSLSVINVSKDVAMKIICEQITKAEKLQELGDAATSDNITSWWDVTQGRLSTIDEKSKFCNKFKDSYIPDLTLHRSPLSSAFVETRFGREWAYDRPQQNSNIHELKKLADGLRALKCFLEIIPDCKVIEHHEEKYSKNVHKPSENHYHVTVSENGIAVIGDGNNIEKNRIHEVLTDFQRIGVPTEELENINRILNLPQDKKHAEGSAWLDKVISSLNTWMKDISASAAVKVLIAGASTLFGSTNTM